MNLWRKFWKWLVRFYYRRPSDPALCLARDYVETIKRRSLRYRAHGNQQDIPCARCGRRIILYPGPINWHHNGPGWGEESCDDCGEERVVVRPQMVDTTMTVH